jgi:two-component system sensor histidine kinase PilS (NtrC family)
VATRTWGGSSPPVTGVRWLASGRTGGAVLLVLLALLAGNAFRSPGEILLAAALAAATAAVGRLAGGRRTPLTLLFLADVGWISLSVLGASRVEAGLGLLFALVAFASGLVLGGRPAALVSVIAAAAMVGTASAVPDVGLDHSWMLIQGLLVLGLGAASGKIREHLASREQALAAASRALERMRIDTDTLVRELGSGVLSVDVEGRIVHLNRTGEETLGLTAREVTGRPIEEVLPGGLEPLSRLLRDGLGSGQRTPRGDVEIERDGVRIPLGIGTTVLMGPEGEPVGVVALFQDLTDVRRQEILSRKRDRLAAVGELAAGIAHEIRNSVLPISGSVQLLAQERDRNQEEAKLFEVIEREMENIERFVSALLRYTASQAPEPGRVDLTALAGAVADEIRLLRKPGVTVGVEGRAGAARGDVEHLRQALRNLVMNAVDAVGEEGTILIRVGEDAAGRPWMEVEDDGPGIPAGERERILQPFYTLKPGGTGLGLAIVSRIVEDHEGQLRLTEGAAGGARFRIVLQPAVEEPQVLSRAA